MEKRCSADVIFTISLAGHLEALLKQSGLDLCIRHIKAADSVNNRSFHGECSTSHDEKARMEDFSGMEFSV